MLGTNFILEPPPRVVALARFPKLPITRVAVPEAAGPARLVDVVRSTDGAGPVNTLIDFELDASLLL